MTTDRTKEFGAELAWGRKFWVAVLLISIALVAVWWAIPWQWSPVDDPGQVLTMRDLASQHGSFGAIVERIQQLAVGDREGGVFRPMAWVYPPLIYSLPTDPAHVVRLLMLIVIVLGPVVYFRRKGARPPLLLMILVLLLISAGTLYQGLLLLSIQEVGGVALVSLGLMARQRWLRLALWVLAALFKGPFLWILFGYGFVLWREGRRKMAVASAALGLAILAINLYWSSTGSYTGNYRIAPFAEYQWINASKILEPVNGAILLAALWWLVVTQTRAKRGADFPIFATAAIGYFVQMIPWGFTAYYMGPISFLLGLMIASTLTDVASGNRWSTIVALLLPVFLAAWILVTSLGFVLRSNAIIEQGSACLAQAGASRTEIVGGWLYLTSSEEGPIRLTQNTELFYPEWSGDVALDTRSETTPRAGDTTHVMLLPGTGLPSDESGTDVCSSNYVTLVELE